MSSEEMQGTAEGGGLAHDLTEQDFRVFWSRWFDADPTAYQVDFMRGIANGAVKRADRIFKGQPKETAGLTGDEIDAMQEASKLAGQVLPGWTLEQIIQTAAATQAPAPVAGPLTEAQIVEGYRALKLRQLPQLDRIDAFRHGVRFAEAQAPAPAPEVEVTKKDPGECAIGHQEWLVWVGSKCVSSVTTLAHETVRVVPASPAVGDGQ